MKKLICVLVLALAIPFLSANAASVNNTDRRLAPIDDPLKAVFTVKDQRIDKQKIKAAISAAGLARDWKVMGEADGRTTLSTSVRGKHFINLEVNYDDSSYQFVYLNSANLMYVDERGNRLIHRNYNVWIRELAAAINNILGVPAVITAGQVSQRVNAARGEYSSQPSMPAVAASGFAGINDVDVVPVRPEGKPRYQHYLTLQSPKAFAISENGSWRFVWNKANAMSNVLSQCEERYGKCWLYAVDDRVVWNADPEKRVGNALQPKAVP